MSAELVIVGAGAAGLWAAVAAAERGTRVLLLERTPRCGTKILASGGSRCNLTTTLAWDDAARLFRRRGERFLRHAFQALPPQAVRERFAEWGVPTIEAPLEKIFPASQSARDVRDALERRARELGVEVQCDVRVERVAARDGSWDVQAAGETWSAARLILAAGGQSYPGSGTTGDGYRWLAELGLKLAPQVPALVPLTSSESWVAELAGIAWQTGAVKLVANGKVLSERVRPLLFTHRGVSGPGAMDLSVHVAQDPTRVYQLSVDFYPELERETLRERCIEGARAPGRPRLSRVCDPPLPRRLAECVARQAQLASRDPFLSEFSKSERHRWIETVKSFMIPVDGTEGFEKAEVTAGGLDLGQINPRTMEVNGHPGLYVIGEMLNLDGPIGGLNFQAAFACGEVAGSAAAGALGH